MSQTIFGPEGVFLQKLKSISSIENMLRGRYFPGHTQPSALPCLVYQVRDGQKVNGLNFRSRLTHTLLWVYLCSKSYEQTRALDNALPGIELKNQAPGVTIIGGLEVRRIRVLEEVSDEVLPSQINEETPPRYRTRRVWISWMQPLSEA